MKTLLNLTALLFAPPHSVLVTAATVVSFSALANSGYMETKGKHLQYSKFFSRNSNSNSKSDRSDSRSEGRKSEMMISSRIGMLILYTPAFVFGAASFCGFPDEGMRFLLVRLALTLHFLKRILEVLFVHKFSGGMALEAAITVSLSYFVGTATMIYAQHLSRDLPEPSINLSYLGVVLFILGMSGNFYHHYALATLRRKGEREYKIPRGGLFNKVICPHYLFEVVEFWGVSMISQTLYALSFTLGTTLYLMGRSYATRKWYLSKFEDFPKHVKAMIPFIF